MIQAFVEAKREGWHAEMIAVGFEPTPLRTGALSQRLRPLGQTVLEAVVREFKVLRVSLLPLRVK